MKIIESLSAAVGRLTGGSADQSAAAPAGTGVAQNSASTSEPDRFQRVAGADLAAKHGGASGPVPDLLGQWKAATLKETLIAMAVDDVFKKAERDPRLQKEILAEVEQALTKIEAQAKTDGRPLTAEDRAAIEQEEFYAGLRRRAEPQLAAYEAKHAKTPAARAALVAGALQAGRDDLGNKLPFLANIVSSDAAVRAKQRAKETVVFENKDVVVVADFRVKHKVLVLPQREGASFLDDLKPAELQQIARVAGAIERAIAQATGAQTESWVNAPQDITQSHLHVHVQPKIAKMDAAQITAMQAAIGRALSQQFPSS